MHRIIKIKTKYNLSVDRAEADAIDSVLTSCDSHEMIFYPKTALADPTPHVEPASSALDRYDDNDNGRITCAEARRHGIAPVKSTHPAYSFMNDRDGDGTVCE